MPSIQRLPGSMRAFVVHYRQHHAHPLNATLHILGVPSAFIGIYHILTGRFRLGGTLCVFGYALQFIGHRAQGNEVGEVTLAKKLWRRFVREPSV